MKPIVTYRGLVYPWHCDHMGHMNVAVYVGKFDEASWHLLAAIGITPRYTRETGNGMAGVQQNITYKRELFPGAIVEIRSRVVSIANRKMTWLHEMVDAESGELVAFCELTGVHISREQHRATPFPAEIRAAADALLAGEELPATATGD